MPSNETKSDLTTSSKAPKSDENDYEQRSKDLSESLVHDFLYHDARRIASFLSQFETYGVVQLIKATETTSRASATKTAITAGGGLPLVAKGEATRDHTVTESEGDSADLTYDPLWTHARTLLRSLESADLINKDIRKARIGQFVMVTGALAILDLSTLKILWDSRGIQSLIAGAIGGQKSKVSPPVVAQAKTIAEVLKALPHGVQARLGTKDGDLIWCGLRGESLVGSSADLLLEHGALISGTWNVLGVLDAVPDGSMPKTSVEAKTVADSFIDIAQMMWALAPMARNALGRPATSYGMTPLLIFREVSG